MGIMWLLKHTRVWQRVEIATEQQLDRRIVGVGPEMHTGLFKNATQSVRQHHHLDQLDITELRVPMDMCCTDQQRLMHLVHIRWQTWVTQVLRLALSNLTN